MADWWRSLDVPMKRVAFVGAVLWVVFHLVAVAVLVFDHSPYSYTPLAAAVAADAAVGVFGLLAWLAVRIFPKEGNHG